VNRNLRIGHGWRNADARPGVRPIPDIDLPQSKQSAGARHAKLGTGANTAIFSVLNGIVLRPLPFPSPGQLVFVTSSQPDQNVSRIKTSSPDFEDFRDRNHSFQQIAEVIPNFTETLVGQGEPQVIRCTASR
jgi:hypothetical protein